MGIVHVIRSHYLSRMAQKKRFFFNSAITSFRKIADFSNEFEFRGKETQHKIKKQPKEESIIKTGPSILI